MNKPTPNTAPAIQILQDLKTVKPSESKEVSKSIKRLNAVKV